MTLNRFWILFFSTMTIGILTGLSNAYFGWFGHFGLFYGIEVGGFVSATALMGFWAYLMLNFTAHSFLQKRFWEWVQLLLIVLVGYDLIYFRHLKFGQGVDPWLPYVAYAVFPFLWAAFIAGIKVSLTKRTAYIPTLFFMYVFTALEWFVAIRENVPGVTETVGLILMVCNAWLILILGKLLIRTQKPGIEAKPV